MPNVERMVHFIKQEVVILIKQISGTTKVLQRVRPASKFDISIDRFSNSFEELRCPKEAMINKYFSQASV